MHSWVFRHRARLKAIFGPARAPEAAPASLPAAGARRVRRLAGTAGAHRSEGTVDRGSKHVLLRPMPPPEE